MSHALDLPRGRAGEGCCIRRPCRCRPRSSRAMMLATGAGLPGCGGPAPTQHAPAGNDAPTTPTRHSRAGQQAGPGGWASPQRRGTPPHSCQTSRGGRSGPEARGGRQQREQSCSKVARGRRGASADDEPGMGSGQGATVLSWHPPASPLFCAPGLIVVVGWCPGRRPCHSRSLRPPKALAWM